MTYGDEEDEPTCDSGPFCRHFNDPADCDEKCTCGHSCSSHPFGNECHDDEGCSCLGYEERDEDHRG